jgi:hypothetical protein
MYILVNKFKNNYTLIDMSNLIKNVIKKEVNFIQLHILLIKFYCDDQLKTVVTKI